MRTTFKVALLVASALVAVPAYAQEINTDPGFDVPAEWMPDTGWSVSGGKAVAAGVDGLDMLMQHNPEIKKGHKYEVALTISGYVSGSVRASVGIEMPTPISGTWVEVPDDIADNFTYSSAVKTDYTPKASYTGPGDSAEAVGAFRFGGGHAKFDWVDPLVNPGTLSAHIHEFVCNTDIQADWTFEDFRAKGSSTCGNTGDPTHAVNRSGYWHPGMMVANDKGLFLKRLGTNTIYYKAPPDPTLNYTGHIAVDGDPATDCADKSPTNDCRNIPTGLRMRVGYGDGTGANGGPTDTTSENYGMFGFDCWSQSQVQSPIYHSIEEARTSGHASCTVGNSLRMFIDMPGCWKAPYVDSPNHRDHLAYSVGGVCPSSHPVVIPGIGIMNFYLIDQDFLDGKYRLSMDEMVAGATPGSTLHFDYWEAWSPTARNEWYDHCIKAHNSCSLEFGTANGLKNSVFGFDQAPPAGGVGQHSARPDALVPTRLFGMSQDFSGNGTYTVELTAPGDGVLALMGNDNFVGQVDNFTVTEVSTTKGPVTVD